MIDTSALRFQIEPMRVTDVDAMMPIEEEAFTAPWSARAYTYELQHNANAYYYVARPVLPAAMNAPLDSIWQRARGIFSRPPAHPAPLVGYAGFWFIVDEAHISTIATHAEWRRRGIGELLLIAMLERALELRAVTMTLEARVSNLGALALYRKYGFEVVGTRTKYYHDNNEDAFIMTTPPIQAAEYRERIGARQMNLRAGLAR
ncbi:MAG: ribosomal protein S18-alanine N-acetyltransferase [Chloroflexi bacterium]|nr:ribosomal protein S18-alanine N-acetyltransferase [Chloroflexota bacterium]